MLMKKITYTDYNGNERNEEFYFNLSKAEITEMSFSKNGGYDAFIRRIVAQQDSEQLIAEMKKIIQRSYGQKSLDGRRFIKSQELLDEFMQTEAYSNLFMELAFDAEAAAAFINGILPADMREALEKVKPEAVSEHPELALLEKKA